MELCFHLVLVFGTVVSIKANNNYDIEIFDVPEIKFFGKYRIIIFPKTFFSFKPKKKKLKKYEYCRVLSHLSGFTSHDVWNCVV